MTFSTLAAIPPVRRLTSPLKLTIGLMIAIAGPAMAVVGTF